jgi:hypothetical protein
LKGGVKMSDTLIHVVEKFINTTVGYSYDLNMLENLFWGYTKKNFEMNPNLKPKESAFLSQRVLKNMANKSIDDVDVKEAIGVAIKESVRAYTRDKDKVISVYKDFVNFIMRKYRVSIPVEFPSTSLSEFERQMFIVKEFHEEDRTIEFLEDKLWVSDTTIEKDLNKLRSEEGVSFLGQKISIRGVRRHHGTAEFDSTVHPIFLALNITQVIALLRGLQYMSKNELYREYVLKLSGNIWNQLSDYAKRRLKEISNTISTDLSWYEELDRYSYDELFFTEKECSNSEGVGNILDFIKNRKKCTIEYKNDNGDKEILTNCLIRGYNKDQSEIIVKTNGKEYSIKESAIIQAYESKSCLL